MVKQQKSKFDWPLFWVILIYLAKVGVTFGLFKIVTIHELARLMLCEFAASTIIAVIAAVLSRGSLMKCFVGVFAWLVGVLTLFFLEFVDGRTDSGTLVVSFFVAFIIGIGSAILQFISYFLVMRVQDIAKKK